MIKNALLDMDALDTMANLPVTVEVRIGKRVLPVSEIAGLGINATVTLDKPAGETLDVYVGNLRLASAEVVVIEDRLAVRITRLDLNEPPLANS
jgi:flagellar motor switch protein FliN/FliY